MPANASLPTASAPELLFDQALHRRSGRRPANDTWQWRSLFAAAGFAFGPDELDADDDTPDVVPTVQRQISAAGAPALIAARRAPASVFDLAERPVELRSVMRSERPTSSVLPDATLTRRVVRVGNITCCTLVPITETAEWAEREQARRARQRPPKTGTRKLKKAIARWGLFDGSME